MARSDGGVGAYNWRIQLIQLLQLFFARIFCGLVYFHVIIYNEDNQLQKDFFFQFHKTIIWEGIREQVLAMFAYILEIIMLETTEAAWMKVYEDYDYFSITHPVRFATVLLPSCGADNMDFSCSASNTCRIHLLNRKFQ